MYSMPLKDLLDLFAIEATQTAHQQDARQKQAWEEIVISITLDSRQVTPGCVFFACKGHAADGRDYVLAAQELGALAIIYEADKANLPTDLTVPAYPVHGLREMVGHAANVFYHEPSQELQVFGVTGTNGKTTCCYLLVQALSALGMKASMIGTIGAGTVALSNAQIANAQTADSQVEKTQDDAGFTNTGLTTPDPIAVHKMLAEFRDQGVTQVCMEVSSHALDQGRVNGVSFFCTLFTNLSHDHLDYHQDMTSYGLAKQRLFTDFHSELVITNAADELGARLIDVANAEFIVQYGQGGDVYADEVTLGAQGIDLVIEGNGVEFELTTPLIGKVNVPNIEMLVATLLALSTSVEDIQNIVSQLKPAPGRMEMYSQSGLPSVVVDYAHTPDALEKALNSLNEHCAGELWCVFGCGGDRDADKRPVMGALAEQIADKAIITNDNPRSENPELIAQNIQAGMKSQNGLVMLDRAKAIRHAIDNAAENDWVLVAGKGHEATQTIGKSVLPFSDREHVAQAMGLIHQEASA